VGSAGAGASCGTPGATGASATSAVDGDAMVASSGIAAWAGVASGASTPTGEPEEMAMIGVPTSTVSPSCTSRSETVPEYGDGSSTRDFAVSISTMTWLTLTASPGPTRHDTISASVRPSPTSGRLNCESVMATPGAVGFG